MGTVVDVIDKDPKNDPDEKSWDRFLKALGEKDGLEYFMRVHTPSGGEHYYIPTLGVGRKYNPIPGFPGIDLQAERSLVFLPPTRRKGGTYTVDEFAPDEFPSLSNEGLRRLVSSASSSGKSAETFKSISEWKDRILSAPSGSQHEMLRSYVNWLEMETDNDEIVIEAAWSVARDMPAYRPGHPYTRNDIRELLHKTGRPIGNARPGELDDIGEPVRSSEESQAQKHANILALMRLRASLAARDVIAAESDVPMEEIISPMLADDLVAPRPAVTWAVESIATAGAQVTLPSSRKTGKTTFLLNLARSAGNGTPFLDRFECSLDGNIGYINAEMLRADILGYCDRLGGGTWLSRLTFLHCRERGFRLNLFSDTVCENVVRWCARYDVEWLIMDPWKNFLTWAGAGMNDNDAVLRLSDVCRALAVSARLQLMMIPMHTTQTPAEDGYERGKGAGELEDGADWLWRYTRVGGADPRVFSVEGRGPGVDEIMVDWDSGTGLLSAGTGTRVEARRSSGSSAAREALELLLLGRSDSRAMTSELTDAMKGSAVGSRTDILAAVRAARVDGTIIATKEGRTTWLSLG
jgi:hypothetical protein